MSVWQLVASFFPPFRLTMKIKLAFTVGHDNGRRPISEAANCRGFRRLPPNKTNPWQLYSQNIPGELGTAIPSNCLSSFFRYNQTKMDLDRVSLWQTILRNQPKDLRRGPRYIYNTTRASWRDQKRKETTIEWARERERERERERKNDYTRGIEKQRNRERERERGEERRGEERRWPELASRLAGDLIYRSRAACLIKDRYLSILLHPLLVPPSSHPISLPSSPSAT